jgi:hypothetical protein
VTRLGDLFAASFLKPGGPTQADIELLRGPLNNLDGATGLLSNWMNIDGNMSPDLFTKFAPHSFTTLPPECASLRFDAQSIPDSVLTVPVVNASSTATWAYGVEIDTDNGQILIHGVAGQSVYAFACSWQWASNSSGTRRLRWTDTGANTVEQIRTGIGGGVETLNELFHVRRAKADDTAYDMRVYQDSGGALDGQGIFAMFRIR